MMKMQSAVIALHLLSGMAMEHYHHGVSRHNYLPHLFNDLPDYWGAKANVEDM